MGHLAQRCYYHYDRPIDDALVMQTASRLAYDVPPLGPESVLGMQLDGVRQPPFLPMAAAGHGWAPTEWGPTGGFLLRYEASNSSSQLGSAGGTTKRYNRNA